MVNQNKIFSFNIKLQAKKFFPCDVESTVDCLDSKAVLGQHCSCLSKVNLSFAMGKGVHMEYMPTVKAQISLRICVV